MPTTCDDLKPRMMELLYGELSREERALAEAHVDGCARCREELAGFRRTRATLTEALDQPAPARARENILRVAAEHARARTNTKPSVWEWLRSHWTLPTLATVGAVAVFLLTSRLFLEPEKTLERGRQGLSPTVAQTPAEPPLENLAPSAPPTPEPEPKAMARAEASARQAQPKDAVPKPATERPRRERAAAAKAKAEVIDDLAMGKRSDGQFAAPPPPRVAAVSRAAADESLREPAIEGLGGKPAPATAAAPAPAPVKGSLTDSETASVQAAPAASAKAAAPKKAKSAGPETPVQRADRLFTEGKWEQAAAAYRALLNREPKHPDAQRWWHQLATSVRYARIQSPR